MPPIRWTILSLAAAGAAAAGAAGAAAAGGAVDAEPALTTASITWSDMPAFFRPMSPFVLTSNFVWLALIFETMIESESPAFFKAMSDSFVSTSCAVSDVAVTRVSAATARTNVSRSLREPIIGRSSRSTMDLGERYRWRGLL